MHSLEYDRSCLFSLTSKSFDLLTSHFAQATTSEVHSQFLNVSDPKTVDPTAEPFFLQKASTLKGIKTAEALVVEEERKRKRTKR